MASYVFAYKKIIAIPIIEKSDLNIGEELESGYFGRVFRGLLLPKGEKVAIKLTKKGPLSESGFLEKTWQILNTHPNIAHIYGLLTDNKGLVSEFVNGNELFETFKNTLDYGEKLDFGFYLNIAKQLFDALSYLRNSEIIHGDIKLENLMLENDSHTLKLIDWGSGKTGKDSEQLVIMGTLFYRLPELYKIMQFYYSSMEQAFEGDVFAAVKVILLLILSEKHTCPFNTEIESDEFSQEMKKYASFYNTLVKEQTAILDTNTRALFEALISGMNPHGQRRPTAQEIYHSLLEIDNTHTDSLLPSLGNDGDEIK